MYISFFFLGFFLAVRLCSARMSAGVRMYVRTADTALHVVHTATRSPAPDGRPEECDADSYIPLGVGKRRFAGTPVAHLAIHALEKLRHRL